MIVIEIVMINLTTVPADDNEISSIPPAAMYFMKMVLPYILAILGLSGIIGNVTSVIIFIKRRKQDRVSGLYLSIISLNDLLTLTCIGIPMWLFMNLENLSHGRYQRNYVMGSDLGCKIFSYLWNVTVFMSSWTVILFSLERALVTYYPLKMAALARSSKPRKIALATVFVLDLILCIGRFSRSAERVSVDGKKRDCEFDLSGAPEYEVIYAYISNLIHFPIPIIIIIILNVMILVGIRINRMTEGKSNDSSKTDRRASINLMLISTFYVIFNSPFVVLLVLLSYYDSRGFAWFSRQEREDFDQIFLAADMGHYFNFCINPYIYTWSLPFYRKELMNILCFWRGHDKKTPQNRKTINS